MPDDLLVRHPAQELLLRVHFQVFEHVRRQIMRQDAEDDDLIVLLHVEDHLGDVRRRPVGKEFAQRAEIARIDQLLISGSRIRPTM